MSGAPQSSLNPAKATVRGVEHEMLDEAWWKRHTTAEALHEGSAELSDWKTADELENRVLHMELVYMKPDKPADPKGAQIAGDDAESKHKHLEKKENQELMEMLVEMQKDGGPRAKRARIDAGPERPAPTSQLAILSRACF